MPETDATPTSADLPAVEEPPVNSALLVTDRAELLAWWSDTLGGAVDWEDAQRDLAQVSWDGYPLLIAGPLGDPTPHLHTGSRPMPPGTSVLLLIGDPQALDTLQHDLTQRGVQDMARISQPWGERRLTVPVPVAPIDPASLARAATVAVPTSEAPYQLAFLAQVERDPAEWLADFRVGADALEQAVSDLSAADLDLRPHPYAWSIRQHVHHVADMELTGLFSNRFALAEPGREVAGNGYDQDVWADGLRYEERDIAPSLALFRAARDWTVQLLDLLPDAWERETRTPGGDPQPVGMMLMMLTAHALGHIAEIHAIREQHGIPAPAASSDSDTSIIFTGTS